MHEEIGYEWGAAAGRYFAAEAVRDLAEVDHSRIPEAVALLHDALQRFWTIGDFWGAGGAMSGLACIAAMQGVDQQAATYFGAAGVLMDRVGGSLLPSELMTHQETETELKARMARPNGARRLSGRHATGERWWKALAESAEPDIDWKPRPNPRRARAGN